MNRLDFLTKYAVDNRHYSSKDEIDKGLNASSQFVRIASMRHPNVTKEHIDKALNDPAWNVHNAAIRRLKEFSK